MDEDVERAEPDTAGDRLGDAVVTSAEDLATRVAVLSAQVRAIVPKDQGQPSDLADPSDENSGTPERVQALELLLGQAREREDRLTTLTIHDHTRLTELRARIDELEGVKAAGEANEAARIAAASHAADAERRLTVAEAELQARLLELSRLRSRCEGFERELEVLAEEAAAAVAVAARATRLEKERDEARERAATERQLAAQDRDRAMEAERLASQLQAELETAQAQLVNDTELNRRIEAASESPKVLERVGGPSPWVELQHMASATDDGPDSSENVEASEVETPEVEESAGSEASDVEETAEVDIVDLTEAEAAVEDQASEEPVSSTEVERTTAEPARVDGGRLGRLRHWLRSSPEAEGQASTSGL
jgi:hypothetical protein